VLDVTENKIFLSVSHEEDLSKLTNVYMSDGSSDYTVSLLGNVRSQDSGHCDFERIKSVEGVYIANVYDHQEVEKLRQRRKRVNTEKEQK
jgi:Sortilin, neurotensin receptor 3,